MPKPAPTVRSPRKKIVVFGLENVLIPGKVIPNVDLKKVHAWMGALKKYQATHPEIHAYVISAYKTELAEKKLREHGLDVFFDSAHVRAVNESYLNERAEVDRKLYEAKCAVDDHCTDEYFRQVEMQSILRDEGCTPAEMVLIGHDYWFDGFYTRRFAKVDMAFLESSLTSRGKPAPEKVPGVWYLERSWPALKKILEGRVAPPNYAPLDTWVAVTLTGELLGAKGIPQLKRVILQRKADGKGFENPTTR